eukprot:CAMPEP_0206045788 /NCGR_PEP_ID=MMETSP1466-20131121/16855_1 /ASSEMBLY_ACC=CAM_ASM_001126 /TAXON_ID=44452 /ORGANISM="Pavlova gyrans, Strain CCMP608" /LENGTH=124 /DNA_ID=CAMNT_0053420741 /DNA_START=27 /DNA_END=401 /DNA_ORIENTATION=+
MRGRSACIGRSASSGRGVNPFMLIVRLSFKTEAGVSQFLNDFSPMAAAVRDSEPNTLSYEVSQSEKNPLELVIVERYRTKADFVDVHRSMKHFIKFRPKLQALQDAGEVTVTGDGLNELGIGHM